MKYVFTLLFLLQLVVSSQAQVIHISATDTTICHSTPVTFSATSLTTSTPHFQWQINSTPVGADSTGFTTDALNDNDSIRCILYNPTFDTILAISDTIVMQVHLSPPDAGALSGPNKVCLGATVSLNASVTGGVWSTANGHTSVTDGVVKGESAGFFECLYDVMDTVFYIVSNNCGVDTVTHLITVKVLPSPIVDLVFGWSCPFQDFIFTGPRCFGYIYIDTIKVGRDFMKGWMYAVSVNECGCDTYRYYQPVTVYSAITDTPHILSATDKLCVGINVPIAPADDYYTSVWKITNKNAALRDSAGTVYINPIKVGIDTIILTYENWCGSFGANKYDTLIVNIHAQPHVDSVTERLCIDSKVQLHATPSGGVWSTGNSGVISVESQTGKARGIEKGASQLIYTTDGPCSATTDVTVEDCPADAWLSPVPVVNELNIYVLNDEIYTQCAISNAAGQLMHQQPLTATATRVNTTWYTSGIYFVRLTGPLKEKTIPFRKQ